TKAAGNLARVPVLRRLPRRQRQPGLEQRRVDELPAAGDTPGAHRAQDPEHREQAGAEVGDGHADLHRRAALAAGGAHDAAHALRDEIVTAALGIGTRLAEAGDRAVDEARIHGGQRRVVDAEAPGDARTIVLDQDVSG